jgi:hypothetical protein
MHSLAGDGRDPHVKASLKAQWASTMLWCTCHVLEDLMKNANGIYLGI